MVMRDMERFSSEPEERECSSKTCTNTVKSRDRLLTKCEECREEDLQEEIRLDRQMNREMARDAGEVII